MGFNQNIRFMIPSLFLHYFVKSVYIFYFYMLLPSVHNLQNILLDLERNEEILQNLLFSN